MKDNIWNIVLGTIATAILGLFGYVLLNINAMQQQEAAQIALEFTNQDAAELQKELTKIITDIDMRIRLIERDIQWIKMGSTMYAEPPVPNEEGGLSLPDPTPEPPRYNLDAVQQSKK